MMVTNVKYRLLWLVVIAIAMVQTRIDGSARHPACDGYCDTDTPCDDVCEIPVGETYQFITCGDYEGGWPEGACDPAPLFTCTSTCSSITSGSEGCTFEAEETDCEGFGLSDTCGDGDCGTNEDPGSCSTDCGGWLPEEMSEEEEFAWAAIGETMESEGFDDGSFYGISQILNLAAAAGFIPDEDYTVEVMDDPQRATNKYSLPVVLEQPLYITCSHRDEFVWLVHKVTEYATKITATAAAAGFSLNSKANNMSYTAPERANYAAKSNKAVGLAVAAAVIDAWKSEINHAVEQLPCLKLPSGTP